jgi:rod shape-determining protein MreC
VAKTRRSRRPRLTIGLLVLASITIITLDYRGDAHGAIASIKRSAADAFSPVQRGADAVVRPVGNFIVGAANGGELEQENARLRAENGRLQRQTLAGQAMVNALHSLEELDNLPWTQGIPTVAAQVVAPNPSDFAATVTLDKGSANGVADGMPVVGGAGLAGLVISTSSTQCTVRLITDVNSGVGVRYGRQSMGLALAQGDGIDKPLSVENIAPGTALNRGEVLTTSGLQDALYPPLIPVARITSFSSTPSSTDESVKAQPLADLSELEYIDVMQWEPAS